MHPVQYTFFFSPSIRVFKNRKYFRTWEALQKQNIFLSNMHYLVIYLWCQRITFYFYHRRIHFFPLSGNIQNNKNWSYVLRFDKPNQKHFLSEYSLFKIFAFKIFHAFPDIMNKKDIRFYWCMYEWAFLCAPFFNLGCKSFI